MDGKLAAFLVRDSGGKALILIKCSKINQEQMGMLLSWDGATIE